MKTKQSTLAGFATVTLTVFCAGQFEASAQAPPWSGGVGTTYQGYQFTTGANPPAAETLDNIYGSPVMALTIGQGAAGWHNPAAPFTSPGVNDDGAWDIGVGNISLGLTFAPSVAAPGETYAGDIFIRVIGLRAINQLPSLTTSGFSAINLSFQDADIAPEGPTGMWVSRTWTASFAGLTGNTMQFDFNAPSPSGSLIDSVEVYTRYQVVPEPSSALMLVGGTLGLMLRRRRTS